MELPFFIAAPIIIIFVVIFKKDAFIGISTVLIAIAFHVFEAGTMRERGFMAVVMIVLSVVELIRKTIFQHRQESLSQIGKPNLKANMLFAMIGILLLYGFNLFRCRNFGADFYSEQFLADSYLRFLEFAGSPLNQEIFKMRVCLDMSTLRPLLDYQGDFGINLAVMNLVFAVILRGLVTSTGLWASIFAGLGSALSIGFSIRRWISHSFIALISSLILGFFLMCFGSVLSIILGNTQIIVSTIQAVVIAFSAALGAYWGAKRTHPAMAVKDDEFVKE